MLRQSRFLRSCWNSWNGGCIDLFCVQIGGVQFRFSVSFFAVLAWLFACQDAAIWQAAFGACLLHECGHLIMMYVLRQAVRRVTCYGIGIQIQAESCLYPLWQDLLVLLAGPFCNLLAAAGLWLCFGSGTAMWMQLGTGFLNLLPFRQLDGGAALRILLTERWERLLTVVCVLLAAAGIFYGMTMHITNVTYYGFLLFLFLMAIWD